MRDSWRHFAAEFIGIFALVFVGGGAVMSAQLAHSNYVLLTAAIAHGLILAVMVTATMRISGHLNPAVTIGFLVTRRIEPMMGMLYIVAQLLGAVLAAYALKAVFPHALGVETRLGGQTIALDVTMGQAIVCEAIATFFLVFAVFGTAVDPHAPKVGGFAIGLTVAADILAIGPLTGASMNPARSLGPAIASGIFEAQAVYWIGPILGGIVAALLYDQLFLRRGKDSLDHGAVDPRG
ncbi:MAG: major intrinsic protein [Gemmatimonadetes bacterium]|nr:major intrinsic protein [Gemmatimonadota bacterium]